MPALGRTTGPGQWASVGGDYSKAFEIWWKWKGHLCDGEAFDVGWDPITASVVCVYPQSLLQSTESFFNCLNSTTSILTQSLDETRAADLNELASVIEVDYPHMGRSVRYLRQITNGDRPRAPYKQLGFISAGPQANAGVGNVQLGRPAPAPKPHKLRVVFHHRAWWRDRFDGFLPRFGVRWKTCYYVIMVCDDRCAVHQIEHLDRRFW